MKQISVYTFSSRSTLYLSSTYDYFVYIKKVPTAGAARASNLSVTL